MKVGSLLFVAIQAVDGSDGAEEAVGFALNSRGEKQRRRGTCRGAVAKRDHPKTIDNHVGVIGIFHERNEFSREAIERGDFSTAEIAHKDGIAVFAEITGSPNHAPGRIHQIGRASCRERV